MPFDARAAKLLQAGEHIILPEHPGLRLVATDTRRSWIYRYKSPIDGGMRQIKIGEWPRLELAKALAEWDRLRGVRDSGVDPQLEKKSARRKREAEDQAEKVRPYTCLDVVEDYLTGHIDVRRKPKGRAEVRRILTREIVPIADRPAELLLRNEAYELLQGLVDRPVLMGQVRQELGAAWDHALDAGKLEANTPNWWRQILRGKMPRSKGKKIAGEHVGATKRVLDQRELGVLINWLPNFSPLLSDVLTLYLWTGTRGAEIVSMQAAEIGQEPTGWWWTIPKEKTKNVNRANAVDLRVPLVGRALAVAQRRSARAIAEKHPQGYLFPAQNMEGPVEQKSIQGGVYTYQPYAKQRPGKNMPRLPVSRWSPHDLRRSVRTLLASMGCPGEVAEAVLGHMLPGVVGVYNRHSYDAERLEWLTKLDAKLEELARLHAPAAS